MTYPQVKDLLAAPFPAARVAWKPQTISRDRSSALMVAFVDARTVMERLDAVCPGEWAFDVKLFPGQPPTARGRLTVLGLTRSDVGEAGEGEAGTLKAAASDALKRCAVHFGVGRYLYDLPRMWVAWDEARRAPVDPPRLPDWALPEEERTPGAAHVLGALEALRAGLPQDVGRLREVYRHLRAALDAAERAEAAPESAAG
ncbi:single-stranded DNA-binding protein [Deinococcus sp. SDU3-2]|uniref:Single-stranded DNA-binding protein n=1 Tax=Deinococcus terrestris TaxID=2651870 RepID=A0A7X1NT43_9DEIO|nr:Rad52/Rad22 family DNA repair protein [Deinococcus terrestris]MPY65282.1 single-stranded DNA-binding protein [Deinococcus terrestris]